MNDITISAIFPKENGIMSYIAANGGYTFNDNMDLLLLAKCGKRTITPIIELLLDNNNQLTSDNLNNLSLMILEEYKNSWDKIQDTLTLEYNPLSASQYNETIQTDSAGENIDNNNETSQNDVSTVDSLPENFISDGKRTNQYTGNTTNKNTTTRTLTRTSNTANSKPVDLIKSEIDMRINNKFISIIINDVKNYIAMPLY